LKRELYTLVVCFCLLLSASATTYYVDSVKGEDTNSGTSPSAPWQTVAAVNSHRIQAGDQVLFLRGRVWREALNIKSSGAPGNPIAFGAYGSGLLPIISANDKITKWTNYSGSIWLAPASWKMLQVFRNGVRAVNRSSVRMLSGNYQWTYNAAEQTLYIYSTTNPNSDESIWEASHRLYAVNLDNQSYITFDALDLRSNNSNGYAVLRIGATVPVYGITISNSLVSQGASSCVIFENYTNGSFDGITISNISASYCGSYVSTTAGVLFGALTGGPAKNVSISNSNFSFIGVHGDPSVSALASFGIDLGNVQNASLTNVLVANNGSSGINVQKGSSGITITGGSSHDNGQAPAGDRNGIGIGGYGAASSKIIVQNMRIYNNAGSNIEIATTATEQVCFNITIQNNQVTRGQAHGIQIGGGSYGLLLYGNTIAKNMKNGIFLNEGSSGSPRVAITNNTIDGNGIVHGTTNLYIGSNAAMLSQNIIQNSPGEELILPSGYSVTSDYNIWRHRLGGNYMQYKGTTVDFPQWEALSHQDAHSSFGQ
jgi:hypothetical protein